MSSSSQFISYKLCDVNYNTFEDVISKPNTNNRKKLLQLLLKQFLTFNLDQITVGKILT